MMREIRRKGEFRSHAAYAITKAVGREQEASLDICALLESWLVDAPEEDAEGPQADREDRTGGTRSVLFDGGGMSVLPSGNYPTLSALTAAYLARPEPLVDTWMQVLERHLERREESKVWRALGYQLQHVFRAPAEQAARLLDRLFVRHPEVRDSREGAVLIAGAANHLPDAAVRRWMDPLLASPWPRAKQAFGELLGVVATRASSPRWATERVAAELTNTDPGDACDGVCLGLAWAAAYFWEAPERRAAASQIMLGLIPRARGAVGAAILAAFRVDRLLWDAHSRDILTALEANPGLLVGSDVSWLLERLHDLLPAHPAIVASVASAILSEAERAPDRSGWLWHDDALTDIAMTLQRLLAYRALGLSLFERLLEVGNRGARQALAEFDPSPASGSGPRRTLRARRRRRGA